MAKRLLVLTLLLLSLGAIKSAAQVTVDYGVAVGPPHQNLISWTKSVTSDVASYNVYRSSTSGSGYTKIGSVNAPTVQYMDKTTQAGNTYYYVITAVNPSGESANSTEISGTTPTP